MKYLICCLCFILPCYNSQAQISKELKSVTLKTFIDSSKKIGYSIWLDKNPYRHDSLYLYFKVQPINTDKADTERALFPFITKNNKLKFNSLLGIAVDESDGKFKNRIYIAWSDSRYGKKECDVFVCYSDNVGLDWTEPILLSYHPNHSQQFYPQVFVNNKNGELNVFYFDKQNYVNSTYTDIFLAKSNNGGLKWYYYKMNEEPLLLERSEIKLKQLNNFYELEWYNKKRKVQLVLTDSVLYNASSRLTINELRVEKTYAYDSLIKIPFKSTNSLKMHAIITKPLEPDFQKIIFKNNYFNAGTNQILINCKKLGIPKGNYVLTLYFNNKNTYVWITE